MQRGTIGSVRERKGKKWSDENMFFTAHVIRILKNYRSDLSEENGVLADSIISDAKMIFSNYRNRNSDCSYNFWRTKPEGFFPNHKYLSKKKKFALPDDFDDTALYYSISDLPKDSMSCIMSLMNKHVNSNKSRNRNILKKYRKFNAYGTWFGKKMPIEFDVCVLSNVMMFRLQHSDSLTHNDSQSMELLKEVFISADARKIPHVVSPNYKNYNIILYHYAGLLNIAEKKGHDIIMIKDKVISELKDRLSKTNNRIETIMLQSALMKLGAKLDGIEKTNLSIGESYPNFYFFVANMAGTFTAPFNRIFSKGDFFDYKYNSDGFNWALILENEILKSKQIK